MAKDIRLLSPNQRLFWGLVCSALGMYPISIGIGAFPEVELTTPPWVLVLAGLAFVIAGLMILLADHSRINDWLAGVVLLGFGAIGVWVAFFSPDDGFSGGIPFLPRETNILIGRWMFGIGSLISFSMSVWAFRRAFRQADSSAG